MLQSTKNQVGTSGFPLLSNIVQNILAQAWTTVTASLLFICILNIIVSKGGSLQIPFILLQNHI